MTEFLREAVSAAAIFAVLAAAVGFFVRRYFLSIEEAVRSEERNRKAAIADVRQDLDDVEKDGLNGRKDLHKTIGKVKDEYVHHRDYDEMRKDVREIKQDIKKLLSTGS